MRFILVILGVVTLNSYSTADELIPCINPYIKLKESIDICKSNGEPDFAFTGAKQLYDMASYIDGKVIAVMRNNRWGLIQINESDRVVRCVGKCFGAQAEKKYFVILPFKYDLITQCISNYCIAKKKDKFGIIDENDKIIIDFIYDYLEFSESSKLILAVRDKKYGFIDIENKEIIPFKYDKAFPFHQGLSAVFIREKCGYISKDGKSIIPLYYDFCYSFNNNLAAVKKSGKWGYITPQNNQALPFIFEKANPFYLDYATVKEDGKWYIINSKGLKIKELNADDVFPFIKGIARFKRNGKYGFIDTSAKEIFGPVFDEAEDFIFPIINAKINDKGLKADRFGRTLIYEYDKTQKISENITIVWKEGKAGIIDKDLKEIIPPIYELLKPISENIFLVKMENKYGLINAGGKYVIEPKFENLELEIFSNPPTLLKAIKDNKAGVIDISGKTILPFEYDDIEIKNNLIILKKDRYGISTRDGEIIMDLTLDEPPYGYDEIAVFKKDGKYGVLSIKEKTVRIQPIYTKIEVYSKIQLEAIKPTGEKTCFNPENFNQIKCLF